MKIRIRTVWMGDAPDIICAHPVLKNMANVAEENGKLFFIGESLEQLTDFAKALQQEIILQEDEGEWLLIIYDAYIE